MRFFIGSFLLLGMCASTVSAQNLDTVVGPSGSLLGTIAEFSPTEVTIQTRTGKRTLAVNQIIKVSFGDEPKALRTARDKVLGDQYEDARNALAGVSTDGVNRAVIREDIKFYSAYIDGRLALSGGGDKLQAAAKLVDFVNNSKESFHFYAAVELLGNLAVALDRNEPALTYYGQLAEAPWPETKMRANVLMGGAYLATGKNDDALAKFEEVLGASVGTAAAAEQKNLATIGKAVCLAEAGKPTEGLALINKVLEGNESENNQRLFGRAYNAKGRCHLKADQPKEALLAYLHTDLLFFQDPDIHAESLYHLSKLWRDAGKNSERAIKASAKLKSAYAGTKWAK